MKSFFPMAWGDLLYLVLLLLFAVISFLPWSRELTFGNMAVLGWLMAALMVLSPLIALLRLTVKRRPEPPAGDGEGDG